MPDDSLKTVLARLDAIEAKLGTIEAGSVAIPVPTGGLYDFVRPAPGTAPYGLGVQMTTPDVAELLKRACHSVNWRGDTVFEAGSPYLEEVWAEIEALKAAKATDPVVQPYRRLFPEFVGLALLTNVFPVQKYRGMYTDYDRWVGTTPLSFIEAHLKAVSGGGQASGDVAE